MAPLESALQEAPARPRTVDSLMRALLYVSQQLGRPVSEAELRSLAVLPEGPLDSVTFLLAARRLGFDAHAVDLARLSAHELPTPFVVLRRGWTRRRRAVARRRAGDAARRRRGPDRAGVARSARPAGASCCACRRPMKRRRPGMRRSGPRFGRRSRGSRRCRSSSICSRSLRRCS